MKERSEKQLAADRRRCLNGKCRMTPEERKVRLRKYRDDVLADPFRRKQYADYFRKRRARPEIRERTNEQARARYQADLEKSREKEREKYRRLMADPERHAAMLERRRKRRRLPDGRPTAAERAAQIREKLIPRWDRVIAEGREESYSRRTTRNNARLFHMYLHNRSLFDEMMRKAARGRVADGRAGCAERPRNQHEGGLRPGKPLGATSAPARQRQTQTKKGYSHEQEQEQEQVRNPVR